MTQVSSILLSVSSGKFWQLCLYVLYVCMCVLGGLSNSITSWYVCMLHVCMLYVCMCCIIFVALVGSVNNLSISYGQLPDLSQFKYCFDFCFVKELLLDTTYYGVDHVNHGFMGQLVCDEGHCIPACYCKHCHCASQQWKRQAFALPLPCSQY